MVVIFTKAFQKEYKKKVGKNDYYFKKLINLVPTDGKHLALIKDVELKEKILKTFRFYFVQKRNKIKVMTEQELKKHIIKFIKISKKNDQSKVIEKLKKDLKENNFSI